MAPIDVLYEIYLRPRSVSSDLARVHAGEIACLASMGLITTKISRGEFCRVWRVTDDGFTLLRDECFI